VTYRGEAFEQPQPKALHKGPTLLVLRGTAVENIFS